MVYNATTGIYKSPYPDVKLVNQNLWEFLAPKFDKYQDKIALTCAKTLKQITYKELKEQSLKWTGYLLNEKSKKEINVVGIYSPQAFEFPSFILGCVAAGIPYTSIVPVFTPDEAAFQLKDSGVGLMVVDSTLEEKARTAIKLSGLEISVIINGKHEKSNADTNAIYFKDILEGSEFANTEPIQCDPLTTIINILYTSGTTGRSKGVCTYHASYTNLLQANLSIEPDEGEVTLSTMPLFHIGGSMMICFISFSKGFQIVIDNYATSDKILQDITKFKVTDLWLVSTMMNQLSMNPLTTKDILKTVKIIRTGGSAVNSEALDKIMNITERKTRVQTIYGMTEVNMIVRTPPNGKVLNVLGKLDPNIEAKVVDVNTGKCLGPGNTGELCIRSPANFAYYMNNPVATESTKEKGNWVHTGDFVQFDEDGYITFVSRLKELIKVYVQQVSPTEVEETLLLHPAIKDAGVIGIPHEEAGELPKGFLVLHEGKTVTKEEIHKFLEGKLAPYKQLKAGIQFVNNLPRNSMGKLVRAEVAKLHSDN